MAARQAASEAPSKMTQTLVERLRQQLSVKEKQQKVRLSCGSFLFLVTLSLSLSLSQALNEALRQVRAELLDATQKAILSHTHQEVTEVNLQKMVQKRTSELEV